MNREIIGPTCQNFMSMQNFKEYKGEWIRRSMCGAKWTLSTFKKTLIIQKQSHQSNADYAQTK